MNRVDLLEKIDVLRTKLLGEVVVAYRQRGTSYGSERFAAWQKAAYKLFDNCLPSASERLRLKLDHNNFFIITGESDFDEFWRLDGENCLAFLDSLSTDVKNGDYDEDEPKSGSITIKKAMSTSPPSDKIFIVHGHDEGLKTEVELFLRTLGFDPIILHKQASGGMTIIEKIETYTDVGFGIVLYTPDDSGAANAEAAVGAYKSRSRQNVVFEHGYLMAKLGRKRVVPVVKNIDEMPGDVSGIVYVGNSNWKHEIAKEMHHAGYVIDSQKLLKA